ncbi:Pickpocket protein 28 [Orchesella cincta]|uniref:Pickpocket protein 28 n=1 Tax=Orchesella cincta TaxID=48709 RepID=A0A1D2N8C1_ORCCI|nr:Pickpocket protein 28 [Orchesella cincta]
MNRVLRSKANEYIRIANGPDDDKEVQKARQDVYYLDHVCSVSNKPFSKMFNYSMKRGSVDPELLEKVHLKKEDEEVVDVRRFLRKASQPCDQMIQLCMWEGDALNCKNSFRPIETNFGKCCVFNMLPHTVLHTFTNDERDTDKMIGNWKPWFKDKLMVQDLFGHGDERLKYPYPKRQHRAGKASGLMFLLDPALNELSVHFSADVPHVTDFGLAIRPNYEHFVSITPDVIMADDVIRSYAIISFDSNTYAMFDKRNCYFEGELPLKYYNVYSASNCLDECVANITYERCSCVRYYMPRDDSREICRPRNITCAEDVKKSLYKSGVKHMCQQCLPTCTEIKYSASSTMAPLQRLDLWVDDESNKTAPWAKSNISIVHVYFGQDSTYPKVRGQMYGITDLIANTGGLLGLCMGFSMLSLVEVIYLCTIRHWCRRKHSKHSMKTSPQVPVTNGCNGNSINMFLNPAEARRVNMKPGDDGRYHLQNKIFCNAPLPTVTSNDDDTKSDQNGKMNDVPDAEDSRL